MRRYGIDLGTTNTCIYYAFFSQTAGLDERESSWTLTPVNIIYSNPGDLINPRISHLLPSVVFARKKSDGSYEYYIGEVAIQMAKSSRATILINTKRLMCNDDPDLELPYGLNAESVARLILKDCFYSIAQTTKKPMILQSSDYCITQPAAFSLFASNSVYKAASSAGFPKPPKQLREPLAALLSFIYSKIAAEEERELLEKQAEHNNRLLTVVVDIGGGTTDVAIQEINITGQREVLSDETETCTGYAINFLNMVKGSEQTEGVASTNLEPAFGGLDFDNEIFNQVAIKLGDAYKERMGREIIWEDEGRANLTQELYIQVKDYKESLSTFQPGTEPDFEAVIPGAERIEVKSGATEVYEWTKELCYRSEGRKSNKKTVYAIIRDTIERSGYRIEDIDYIYVTGGMSSFRPIRDMLIRRFASLYENGKLIFSGSPLEDIARGAAVCDCYFKVNMPNAVLFYDLMIDDPCGEPLTIVQANTPLPAEGPLDRFMKTSNPRYCYVDVLYGRGAKHNDLRKARSLREPIDTTRMGSDVSAYYSIDEHSNLDVTLTIHRKPEKEDLKIELIHLVNYIDFTKGDADNG